MKYYISSGFAFKINIHEHFRNQQGLFTFIYHWILVTDEPSLLQLQDDIQNITHIAAVTWQQNYVCILQSVMLQIDSAQWRIQWRGEGANPRGGRRHMILPNFPKNCMKLKEFGSPGGHIPRAPFRYTTGIHDFPEGCQSKRVASTYFVAKFAWKGKKLDRERTHL